MTPRQREEARAAKSRRDKMTNPIERLALSNEWSKTEAMPLGLLIQALENEQASRARDIETIRKALFTGQVSAVKVDAQRAFERLLAQLEAP